MNKISLYINEKIFIQCSIYFFKKNAMFSMIMMIALYYKKVTPFTAKEFFQTWIIPVFCKMVQFLTNSTINLFYSSTLYKYYIRKNISYLILLISGFVFFYYYSQTCWFFFFIYFLNNKMYWTTVWFLCNTYTLVFF